jgi:hypothetical protein
MKSGSKLKTSILNQFSPHLTPEQKLTRKLNDVEKWLVEKESHSRATKNCEKIHKNLFASTMNNDNTSTPKKNNNVPVMQKAKNATIHHSKQQKEAINSTKNKTLLEYSNVQVPVEANDCENLISMSEDDEQSTTIDNNNIKGEDTTTPEGSDSLNSKSSVRFVHIHHHYLHFDEDNEKKD